MTDLLRSESRKAAASGSIWWMLLAAIGIVALGTFLSVALGDAEGSALLTDEALREAMHGAAGGSILMAAVGVIGVAGEWRTGQISQTFMSTPQRWKVVLAKTHVYAGIGLLYGTVAAAVGLAAAWGSYQGEDVVFPFDRAAVWFPLAGVVLSAALLGVIGVAVGALLRNQVLGLIVTLGWFFLVEPILGVLPDEVTRWFPGSAQAAVTGFPGDDQLAVVPAGLALTGVALLLLVIGTYVVRRSDVTS